VLILRSVAGASIAFAAVASWSASVQNAGAPAPLNPAATQSGWMAQDTPPASPSQQSQVDTSKAPRVSPVEYEGWRQYSVQCARCHGQDVLPNPVAANLLTSLAAGGPIDTPQKFTQVVTQGRAHRGMPAFGGTMTPEQIQAVYAYVKGRADKRIPPGRPQKPAG
jgi:mono/diheme cytochrome c family protein